MITGPKYKICRRLGSQVFEKCQSQKFQLSQSRRKPVRRRNPSDYSLQLLEKQKVRFSYGLKEHQFSSYVAKAIEGEGIPAEKLFESLETRLDNVVYRLGLTGTRRFARQLVSHGHVTVNGRKLNVASHVVKEGDVIGLRKGTENKNVFDIIKENISSATVPNWIKLDKAKFEGTITGVPRHEKGEDALDLSIVVQFYTR